MYAICVETTLDGVTVQEPTITATSRGRANKAFRAAAGELQALLDGGIVGGSGYVELIKGADGLGFGGRAIARINFTKHPGMLPAEDEEWGEAEEILCPDEA